MAWQGEYSKLFIDGAWTEPAGSERFAVVSPFTEEVVAETPAGSKADVDRAVAAARKAFDRGPWPRMSLAERMDVLRKLGALMAEDRDAIAALVTSEMGCPISLSQGMQATGPRLLIDAFLELAPRYPWREVRRSSTGNGLVLKKPVGVVAAIVPWNAPLLISMIKLAPALLSGCAVVLKPSPETPLDSYWLADALVKAGIPEGVVNIVPADREVSEHLATYPDVDKVTFTGSTAAGRRIASLCGQDLRRLTLELGGKSAAIVLDDADFGAAIESLKIGSLRNTGQVCSNKTRIAVSRKRQAEFVERYTAMVAALPVGDPMDPKTQQGPLVSRRQRERVEGYIDIGRKEGAKVALGGGRPSGLNRGWFVEPTVFTAVDPSMRIAQEEIFGPVVAILTYEDENQAVAIANNSAYGLNGSVFTADLERGLAIAQRVRTGTVELNGSPVGFHSPIGGFKASGIGREAGVEGFDAYVEIQSIGLPPGFVESVEASAR